jgi:hypothetical protein
MHPEEAVLASEEALVKTPVPVHWGAFSLALHDWTDPIIRFRKEAFEKKMTGCYPRLGQIVIHGKEPSEPWWNS